MSVGVTVHEIRPPSPIADGVRNPLADLEMARKAANEKLRIRRLMQVRQQSKDLAAKVRQGYQQAKEKELAKIEQTKQDEMKAWKRRQIAQLQDEYARCIGEVGEAHKAAEAAEECAVWFEEKRAAQQAVALARGRQAEETVARERSQRKEADAKKKRKPPPNVPSKSIAVQVELRPSETQSQSATSKQKTVSLQTQNDGVAATPSTLSPYEQFRATKGKSGHLEHKPTTTFVSSESESEDEEICGVTGRADKENVPSRGKHYSATEFTSPSGVGLVPPEPPPPPPQRLQPFTQISDLIQQRRQRQEPSVEDVYGSQAKPASTLYSSYGTHKAVQFDDLSENNTLSFPTSSAMTTAGDYRQPSPDELPRKGVPFVRQPMARPSKPFEAPCNIKPAAGTKKRCKAVLPTEAAPSSSVSGGASTKVQYYDCNTHFRKEYDQPIGFVRREERRAGDPNAMEEASRYEKLQHELATARSIPTTDHLKPALEKQQIRKDYEKLSNELDHLTREQKRLKSLAVQPSKSIPTEATINQKAAERQRKANEAIENLLQRRTLVTCPMVHQPQAEVRTPAERPSVVNVADSGRGGNRDVSSDSCTSIVLGSFDRPGIPLPTEKGTAVVTGMGEPGGMDKIGQMKALLEQLNEQRRVLMAEIDQAKTTDPTEAKATEVEQLKRRQEELAARQELLRQREREVEELGRQLREKMALLAEKKRKVDESKGKNKRQEQQPSTAKPYAVHVETKGLKEQIAVAVEQPSIESSTRSNIDSSSETSAVERTAGNEIPVKIIITVNEKPSKRKKSQKKMSPKVVSTEEVAPMKLPEKPLPLAPSVAIEQQKQVAAGKPVPEDVSLGGSSTTSTVYRSLPPKIGSLKIQNIIRELPSQREVSQSTGPAAASVNQSTVPPQPGKPKHQLGKSKTRSRSTARRGTTFNPQLMQYIVRLLGMSHQSIDQLGVSSSTVTTPNASVVNVTANRSATAAVVHGTDEDHERTARLRKFIDENYNFLQEIDETLRRSSDQSTGSNNSTIDGDRTDASGVNNDDVSHVEDVWMSTLRRRERAMQANRKKEGTDKTKPEPKRSTEKDSRQTEQRQNSVGSHGITIDSAPTVPASANQTSNLQTEQQQQRQPKPSNGPTTKESSLKSILKSPKRDVSPKVAKIITPQGHVEIINLSDQEEQAILERYSQLTERGSQRIAELSQMISQVREEKRRLVEDSLSSFEQQESTKYMDLPATIRTGSRMAQATAQPQAPPTILSPPQQSSTQPPSSAAGAATLVQLDDPVSEEIDNIISSKQIGLSKDSGIAMSRPLTASDIRESPSEEGSQAKEPLPIEPFLKDIPKPMSQSVSVAVEGSKPPYSSHTGIRKAPPPVAITRYSPQLDEAPVHELSTIPEVETPAAATSKVNLSLSTAGGDRTERPANGPAEQVLIEARNRLLTEEDGPNLGYDRFPLFEEYVRQAMEEPTNGGDIGSNLEKTVPGNDTTGELKVLGDVERMTANDDERRLQYRRYPAPAPVFDITEEHAGTSHSEANASDASLPDVVAELRKLNIVMKPFDHTLDDSNRSTPFSEQLSDTAPPANVSSVIAIQRTSVVGTRTRSSRSQAAQIPTELTLGQDLEQMVGLQWASSMLRKQQEQLRKCNDNSSSSSLSLVDLPKDKRNNEIDHPEDGEQLGRPLNLAEFISRELMIRTQSELQSSVSSSPVSHGTLLRSLLSISNLTNSSDGGGTPGHPSRDRLSYTQTSDRNVQRTSTPVASKSASGSSLLMRSALASGAARDDNGRVADGLDANGTGGGLFSGESRISSVHGWSSSSGHSEGKLTVPNVRLERRSSNEAGNEQGAS
ncbi:uncharacterized protein LOC118461808 isoform X1 [Anopheles albimanus]|uniref:uncharacterized protein LOC118461808 isoform X1 n=1 Tax=Anopheles albimanus TaxID=7167 RepID=UPI00163FC88E|nr:uncharacterized protein LOC118461808 isoform X1 [Anopheles albimanus]